MGPTILVVALAATAGCGGGGTAANSSATPNAAASPPAGTPSPSVTALAPSSGAKGDIAAITKLARAIETGKAATVCRTLMTPAMITATFGTVDHCVAADDEPSTGAGVASVQVTGTTATAVVTDKGGSSSGATGTWHFERSGKTWKLTEWGVDYLRSRVSGNFGPKYSSTGADDPLAVSAYRFCVRDGMLAKDDPSFRRLTLEMQSDQNTLAGPVFAACAAKAPGGESPFRATFDKGVRDQLHAFGAPTEAADCVVEKLRTALDEAVLINAVLDGPGSKQLSKVSTTVTNAARACAKGSTGLQPTIRAPKHRYAIRPLH
jgi:hypothetical protein